MRPMGGFIRALRRLGRRSVVENIATTILFAAGLALIAYGAGRIYPPAGLIVGGVFMVTVAVLYATKVGA